MPVYALGDAIPQIDPTAWLAPEAVIIGNVRIGPQASIWPNAVLRGDFGAIEIGARSSIQDGTVVHTTSDHPTVVEVGCVVGHNAYIEGCLIRDAALIGSLAAVLPMATVGRDAVVAAGAVVARGMAVPDRALARGVPASVDLEATEAGRWAAGVERYVKMAERYRRDLRRVG